MRGLLLKFHLWAGIAAAAILVLLGFSGALLVFEDPIDRALNPGLSYVTAQGQPLSLDALTSLVEQASPGCRVVSFRLSERDNQPYTVSLSGPATCSNLAVDPYTGRIVGSLRSANRFAANVHQFHTRLLMGEGGKLITGWSAIILLLLAVSGVILWWPRKIFRVGSRVAFGLHNVAGISTSLFLAIFAITGIAIHWEETASRLAHDLTGTIAPPPIPSAPPGTGRVSASQARQIAEAAVPGARTTYVQFPRRAPDAVRVTMKFPEDRTPLGRTNLYLDPHTGSILYQQTSRGAPLGTRIVKSWNREIHTGDLLGWPTKLLACGLSLALPLMAITGPLIWWSRRRKTRVP